MKFPKFVGAMLGACIASGAASAGTVDDVRARGKLVCGVNEGLFGFAVEGENGVWSGFDVDYCRAVAAAVVGDPMAVEFVPVGTTSRFTALASGELDLLSRNTSWTFTNDVDRKFDFVGVNYYDGQGFMVSTKIDRVLSAKDLEGATICVSAGTTAVLNLDDYFKANNMTYEPVSIEPGAQVRESYLNGLCDVLTGDVSKLAAMRATFPTPSDHTILPETISKEPLGPLVRQDDQQWADIVRWTLHALVAAEELGVTSANIDELLNGTDNPETNRLLGLQGNLGAMLGLETDWAVKAIKSGGNYGEIFARYLGESTPVGLARGLNAQWKDGGLLYAPPFQ